MCLIFFQKCFEIPSFCKYILGTSPYEGNLRAEKIGNSGTQFFLYALLRLLVHGVHQTLKKHWPCDTFFRNHEQNG